MLYGKCNMVRIHHECEIEKSIPRIPALHHEACQVITKRDPEGQIFIFHPNTNNALFFLLSI